MLVVASACQKTSPTRPSDLGSTAQTASVTDATTGITLTSPTLTAPTLNRQFRNVEQPVTLTFRNAVTTGTTPLLYTVDVATDLAFATKAYTKTGLAGGANNSTTLTIDRIAPARTYFWRVRASSGSLDGPYTAPGSFDIGPEVILQAPGLVSPAHGSTASGSTVTLTTNNVARTGPAGTIQYKFDLSTSSAFSSILFTSTVAEQSGGRTSVQVSNNLSAGTYFWRVSASDPSNAVSAPVSAVVSFTYQPFSMTQAIVVDNPPDLASWPETARITRVDFSTGYVLVDFDRRLGSNRWLDVPFGTGDLQYTLGLCGNINGQWYCSAVVQFWFGRELEASAPFRDIGLEWFYDSRWGGLLGYQPRRGETVGIFVAAGNLRDASYTQASCPRICERSNVEFVTWP